MRRCVEKKIVRRSACLSNKTSSALCPGRNRAKYVRQCRLRQEAVGMKAKRSMARSRRATTTRPGRKSGEVARYVQRRVAFQLVLQLDKRKARLMGVARHARGIGITAIETGEVVDQRTSVG